VNHGLPISAAYGPISVKPNKMASQSPVVPTAIRGNVPVRCMKSVAIMIAPISLDGSSESGAHILFVREEGLVAPTSALRIIRSTLTHHSIEQAPAFVTCQHSPIGKAVLNFRDDLIRANPPL